MARLLSSVVLLLAATGLHANPKPGKERISCKDGKGNEVDWFVLYKLPKTRQINSNFMPLKGYEMLYYDSRSGKGIWSLLDGSIFEEKNNPVAHTLAPIYKKDKDVAYVAYNDQLPHEFNGTRGGHTKGILMAGYNKKGTAWLQHSVPRFVGPVKKGYKYPNNGLENGQLFFCISVPLNSVNVIATHLQVQAANVYQKYAPEWAKSYKEFWAILNKDYMRRVPKEHLKVDFLLTNKKKLVMAIAKPPNYPRDIYTQELGRQMNDSITVQSWRNGAGGAQNEHCTPHYSVTDVTVIGVKTKKGYAVFSSREDHSKWYVTRHKGVFCFSSLNRMLSQMKRGGEITCIIDIPLASLFRNSIADRNKCRNE